MREALEKELTKGLLEAEALHEKNNELKIKLLNAISKLPVGTVVKPSNRVGLAWGEYVVLKNKLRLEAGVYFYEITLCRLGSEDKLTGKNRTVEIYKTFTEADFPIVEGAIYKDYKVVRTIPRKRKRGEIEVPYRVAENVYLVEKEVLPKIFNGVDYGVDRQVIIRKGSKIVFWVKGQTGFASRGQTAYYCGNLQYLDESTKDMGTRLDDLYEEHPKLKTAIKVHDVKIKELLDVDFSVAEIYKPNTTILVKE